MKRVFILLAVCSSIFAEPVIHDEAESLGKIDFLELEALNGLLEKLNISASSLLSENGFSEVFDLPEVFNDNIFGDINATAITQALLEDHPHAHLSVIEIINLYEYKSEVHKVKTEDGYILEMHRITGNKTNPSPNGKPVVFLMHGILASSSDWTLSGPQRGLAFLLADAGYDVWMGNARANRYSREHESISTKKKAFWQFSWHEIGIHDLPSMIDYALDQSNNTKLMYIGHSQGSTSFLVMLSERPEYNHKIKVMFSFAPVAYCSNMYNPFFKYIANFEKTLRALLNPLGPWEFLPNRGLYKIVTNAICKGPLQKLCSNFLFLLSGFNQDQMDMALLPAVTAHFPAGSSIYQLFHYAQLIKSEHFRQFDANLIGSSKPPSYKFKNMKVPISLHYANNDWLSDRKDVEKLYWKLPNSIGLTEVPHEKFNHLDFLYAIDVKTLLYNDVMKTMEKYRD